MPAGIQVFSASGQLQFNGTDRLIRFLGIAYLNGSDGSVYDSRFMTGEILIVPTNQGSESEYFPIFSYGADYFSWSYGASPTAIHATGSIFYGVY